MRKFILILFCITLTSCVNSGNKKNIHQHFDIIGNWYYLYNDEYDFIETEKCYEVFITTDKFYVYHSDTDYPDNANYRYFNDSIYLGNSKTNYIGNVMDANDRNFTIETPKGDEILYFKIDKGYTLENLINKDCSVDQYTTSYIERANEIYLKNRN